jgi:TolA-binding protein
MKKILMGLILLFASNSVYAAGGGDWKGYYENLLKGLKSKVQKKFESRTRVSAVAAVRGARQGGDAEALYWKGGVSEKAQKKLLEEKKALGDAVQLIVDGKLVDGKAALESFIKDNPDSLYAADAKEALANLPKDEAKPSEPKNTGAGAAEEKPKTEENGPEKPVK